MSDEDEKDDLSPAESAISEGVSGGDVDDDDEEGEGGFDAKKIILMVVLPLFILGGVGGGLYFSGMLDSILGKPAVEDGEEKVAEKKEEGKDGEPKAGHFVPIPTMLVNLNNTDGTSNYLRLSVQLELEDPGDAAEIEAVMPRVIDQFQTYLRELRPQDLRGSAGLYRLQMELLWRVNQAAEPIKVKDVLFQEILLQ